MKYQVLFSLKNNEKVFIHVVSCSGDWHFKGYPILTGKHNVASDQSLHCLLTGFSIKNRMKATK